MEIRYSSSREVSVVNENANSAPPLKTLLLDPDVRNFFRLIRDNQSAGFREKAVQALQERIASPVVEKPN